MTAAIRVSAALLVIDMQQAIDDAVWASAGPRNNPLAGETILSMHTANAFLSTDLEARLKSARITSLVVAGVITNNPVESTVRMAAEMGFDVTVVEDAVFTFARRDRRGHQGTADDVHALSLANLEQGGYTHIATSNWLCSLGMRSCDERCL